MPFFKNILLGAAIIVAATLALNQLFPSGTAGIQPYMGPAGNGTSTVATSTAITARIIEDYLDENGDVTDYVLKFYQGTNEVSGFITIPLADLDVDKDGNESIEIQNSDNDNDYYIADVIDVDLSSTTDDVPPDIGPTLVRGEPCFDDQDFMWIVACYSTTEDLDFSGDEEDEYGNEVLGVSIDISPVALLTADLNHNGEKIAAASRPARPAAAPKSKAKKKKTSNHKKPPKKPLKKPSKKAPKAKPGKGPKGGGEGKPNPGNKVPTPPGKKPPPKEPQKPEPAKQPEPKDPPLRGGGNHRGGGSASGSDNLADAANAGIGKIKAIDQKGTDKGNKGCADVACQVLDAAGLGVGSYTGTAGLADAVRNSGNFTKVPGGLADAQRGDLVISPTQQYKDGSPNTGHAGVVIDDKGRIASNSSSRNRLSNNYSKASWGAKFGGKGLTTVVYRPN